MTTTPLSPERWAMDPDGDPALFHNRSGRAMSRSGFEYVLASHVAIAAKKAPSLAEKRVTPHVLRHSCAMHTLQATGDVRKVSLWLGHASIQSPRRSTCAPSRPRSSKWSRASPCRN
jgi:integrase/recombinase XerD